MEENMKIIRRLLAVLFITLTITETVFGAHPLVTDDTGTQGAGKFQIEVNSEFTNDKETVAGVVIKEKGGEVVTILSYGLIDNLDIVLGMPYQWKKVKENGIIISDEKGFSDMPIELKWRFFENDGLSFALKPGLTLPTGNENKGLGNGKLSYGLTFITTTAIEPWAFHFNLGYIYNRYKLQADKDANRNGIWHVSIASEVEVVKDLKVVANIGMERDPDKTSNTHPVFILGGLIYSVTENFDIDVGIKGGLTKPETDYSVLAGVTCRF